MNKLESLYEKSLWGVNGSKNKILKISVASLDLFYHCSVICYNEIFLSPMKRFLLKFIIQKKIIKDEQMRQENKKYKYRYSN